ncbi:conserved hypothetical protein [Theileria orientalis strain Shintoku]|uniref:PH domain-containing protein n=1 Tax=Theileria orientalis strain Shintoku TaxID=869250 RepID=J4D6S1_THEOR|nr:conserved hypothetical protein [Theileria orientalis strain Shintoku]BAM39745.1 conserved hypothetical protein [Theileria orientalis strain Shintoku]|eukprot:XP_009690046.1 conserved hypothetical protein [Theileria orientalis strain Shintoku]
MYHNSRQNYSNNLYFNNFRLFLANPSNQYRSKNYGFPTLLAPFYNQNIFIDNPSNVLFYSGSSGISSNPRIEVPNTGENFNFSDSEADVYGNVVGNFLDESKTRAFSDSKSADLKSGGKQSKFSEDDDNELFGSLKEKLVGLGLRDHPCEVCAKDGRKSLFDDDKVILYQDSQGNVFVEPCKHTALRNVPLPRPLSEFNIDDVNVDHLLTYKMRVPELKREDPVDVPDVREFIENQKNLNDLSPIKTNPLREVLLKIAEMKHLLMHDTAESSFNADDLSALPIISLKDADVDYKKLNQWKYPSCLLKEKTNLQKLPSTRKEAVAEVVKAEDASLLEIQEYLRDDTSVEVMMEKYVQLRKCQCSKEALKALKHMICQKLNKQKLYYRGQELRVLDEESQESLFDKVLTNINRTDQLKDSELVREDSSLYTYSSLSLSSYESVPEVMTLAVTDNDFFCDDPDSIHFSTLDAYGWLTVSDEEVRSQQNKILYCELVGSNFSLYPASYKSNYKSISSQRPLLTVHLDDHFSLVRKKDPKKNKLCLKLQGTLIPTNQAKLPTSRHSKEQVWKNNGTVSLRLEGDTQNELMNWFTFLVSRSRVRSFFTFLSDYKVTPLNNTIFFLLYPKMKELVFNRLSYDPECEEEMYRKFVKQPFNYVDFSMRNMEDKHLLHHMANWTQPVFSVNFSLNSLQFSFDTQILVDYVNRNSVQKLFLDNNPLDEQSLSSVVSALASKTPLSYLSLRGCQVYDSLISTLKRTDKPADSGKLVIDFRQCELSADFHAFAVGYPLNNFQIVVQNSHEFVQEPEMDYFMDTKDLSEISAIGSIMSGRLLSTQWRVRKAFRLPFRKEKTDEPVDVYFEYKAPYLIWHNWCPRNKRFSMLKKDTSAEETSKLTEAQAVFIKDVKKVTKEESDWLIIQGKIPDKFKTKGKDTKIVVKGYTDATTKRWYEIIRRWVAGVLYVDYLQNHPATTACRHILSFCSRVDTPELVMNGFPAERKFLMRFLSYMSEQTSLRALNFSNMSLDSTKIQFECSVLKDLSLRKIDWSFNSIALDDDDGEKENLWLLNALLPKVTADHYDISHNPLGDRVSSSKMFFRILNLKPERISLNYCGLSFVFLRKLTAALSKVEQTFESLRIVELEGNNFEYEDTVKFIEILVAKFPNVVDLRLFDSIPQDRVQELVEFSPICNFERASKIKPEVGEFTVSKRVKKSKNTTRQTISPNTNN